MFAVYWRTLTTLTKAEVAIKLCNCWGVFLPTCDFECWLFFLSCEDNIFVLMLFTSKTTCLKRRPPCRCGVVEYAGQLTARVVTGDLQQFGTASARRGCSNLPPLGGSPGFPLSKPVVGQNVAFHTCCTCRAGLLPNLVSALFPAHSTSFYPNFSKSSERWNV